MTTYILLLTIDKRISATHHEDSELMFEALQTACDEIFKGKKK
jgi:hypothetical protein